MPFNAAKTTLSVILAAVFCLCELNIATAQYRYRYPVRRPPVPVSGTTIYAPYAGPGGTLAGQADVISAQGTFMKQQEQARITREKAYQESLKSKKQAFEFNKYIEANTPTYGEKTEKEKGMYTRRIINDPTQTEITSGESLNVMLPFLQQLSRQGKSGPPIELHSSTLAKINLIGPSSSGNLAILNNGNPEWPFSLRGNPLQKQVNDHLQVAIVAAAGNTLNLKQYNALRKSADILEASVKQQYAKEEMDATAYLAASNFMQKFQLGITELTKPGAAKQLGGGHRATGRNVEELVANMTRDGLKFAPAAPGNEAAYVSLHNSMASYAIGSQNSFGFQLQSVAPRKNFRIEE